MKKEIDVVETAKLHPKPKDEQEVQLQIEQIEKDLYYVRHCGPISTEKQMNILHHGDVREILDLLEAYAESTDSNKAQAKDMRMSPEAQIYIYEQYKSGKNLRIYDFLLAHVSYTEELARRLIDDGEFCAEQKLSSEMECYYLEKEMSDRQCINVRANLLFLANLRSYIQKYDLSPKAELILVEKGLNPRERIVSWVAGCQSVISKYIEIKKKLTLAAERALIASGNHRMIMLYIKIAQEGLKDEKALMDRGNPKEINAYLERKATL